MKPINCGHRPMGYRPLVWKRMYLDVAEEINNNTTFERFEWGYGASFDETAELWRDYIKWIDDNL